MLCVMSFAPHVARRTSVPVRAQVEARTCCSHPVGPPPRARAARPVEWGPRPQHSFMNGRRQPWTPRHMRRPAITVRRGSVASLRISGTAPSCS
ncbi:hypothetical protein QJS66_20990 [Kocuria rhizophila]|nr:hypothetical protein QJS66_20990 [Kocuria rhizophila]